MRQYRLGQCRVDHDSSTIWRNQERVDVRPRSMAVLGVLAAHPQQTISKDRLFEQVWGSVVVTEDALTQCIVELRKAFGDSSRSPSYIQTVRGRGFRLLQSPIALDKTESAQEYGPIRSSRWGWVLAVIALVMLGAISWHTWLSEPEDELPQLIVDQPRLLVLPFSNLSESYPDSFADGLTEELIHRLSQLHNLNVIARTSAFYYKGRSVDLHEIAEALDVDYLIEGSVRSDAGGLRITAQLVDAAERTQSWSRAYEFQSDAMLDIQQQVAATIAELLGETNPAHTIEASLQPLTVDHSALLFRGRELLRQQDYEATREALDIFEQLVEIDQNEIRFWLGLAQANLNMLWNGTGGKQHVAGLDEALQTALRLKPEHPDAQAIMANRSVLDQDYATAIEIFRRGLEHNPDHVSLQLGLAQSLRRASSYSEAAQLSKQVLEQDPLNPTAHMNLGMVYAQQRNVERAQRSLRQAVTYSEQPANAFWALGLLYRNHGQMDRAVTAYTEGIAAGDQAHLRIQRARLYMNLGLVEQAQADHRRVMKHFELQELAFIFAVWEHMAANRLDDVRGLVQRLVDQTEASTYDRLVAGIASNVVGEFETAAAYFSAGLMSRPEPEPLLFSVWDIDTGTMIALQYAVALEHNGQGSRAEELVAEARQVIKALSPELQSQPASLYTRAQVLALEGNADAALDALQSAVEAGWSRLYWMRVDPALSSIAAAPRFSLLVDELQQRLAQQRESLLNSTTKPASADAHSD